MRDVSETVIERTAGWKGPRFAELWRCRDLVWVLAWRDIAVRYRQTILGVCWAVLQPILMVAVFTFVFHHIVGIEKGTTSYALFVFLGLLPWTLFAAGLSGASQSVVASEQLVTKVAFSRLAIPFAATAAAVVDFLVGVAVLLVWLVLQGFVPSSSWLLAPIVTMLILMFAIGLGAVLAALNVRYRDIRYVIPFLIQVWMFATPSIFLNLDRDGISPSIQMIANANPLTPLIAAFRAATLGTEIAWGPLAYGAAASVGVFVGGCAMFRRLEGSFADVI